MCRRQVPSQQRLCKQGPFGYAHERFVPCSVGGHRLLFSAPVVNKQHAVAYHLPANTRACAGRHTRHTHTHGGDNHRHRRVSLLSRKRDSPDTNDVGVGHVDSKRPRQHRSTALTRRKERNSTPKKEVIDLMESEDEQAESPDVVADVRLRDRDVALRDRGRKMVEWEDQVPAGRRTRSSAGTRRGMSPSSMHMDADLEVRLCLSQSCEVM